MKGKRAVRRYDVGTLGEVETTPQGGLKIPACPTRVGVFPYLLPDGTTRREYRPPEEVLDPASLASMSHAPVTLLHPEIEGVRVPVTPDNYRDVTVGHIGAEVRPQGDHVATTVFIQDRAAILKIKQEGFRELSCGYSCVLDPTPGVSPAGDIFDVIQREIVYNHVALGPRDWGRAGPTAALRLDSGDAIQAQKGTPVETEIIDGKEYKIGSPEWAAAKNKQLARITAERDAAQGRADSAEKALNTAKTAKPAEDPKAFKDSVSRRVRLITDCKRAAQAASVKFDEEAAIGADEGSLIIEAIKQLDPGFDPNGKSPEYLAGYFASLIKNLPAAPAVESADAGTEEQAAGNAGEGAGQGQVPAAQEQKTDGKGGGRSIFSARQGQGGKNQESRQDNGPDPDKARADMVKNNRDAWRRDLASTKKK